MLNYPLKNVRKCLGEMRTKETEATRSCIKIPASARARLAQDITTGRSPGVNICKAHQQTQKQYHCLPLKYLVRNYVTKTKTGLPHNTNGQQDSDAKKLLLHLISLCTCTRNLVIYF
jgi:hypothetical protein